MPEVSTIPEVIQLIQRTAERALPLFDGQTRSYSEALGLGMGNCYAHTETIIRAARGNEAVEPFVALSRLLGEETMHAHAVLKLEENNGNCSLYKIDNTLAEDRISEVSKEGAEPEAMLFSPTKALCVGIQSKKKTWHTDSFDTISDISSDIYTGEQRRWRLVMPASTGLPVIYAVAEARRLYRQDPASFEQFVASNPSLIPPFEIRPSVSNA